MRPTLVPMLRSAAFPRWRRSLAGEVQLAGQGDFRAAARLCVHGQEGFERRAGAWMWSLVVPVVCWMVHSTRFKGDLYERLLQP